MGIEIRADGAHVSGYVNATEEKSNPVMTMRGGKRVAIKVRRGAGNEQ